MIPLATIVVAASTDMSSSLFSNLGMTLAIAALPVLLIAGTSFLKISIVLSLLRSALGVQEVPPSIVIFALSGVLTLFVMAPVAEEMVASANQVASAKDDAVDPLGLTRMKAVYHAASPPLLAFLKANTSKTETAFYQDLAGGVADDNGFRILLPAFATSELIEAFLMGFLIFLPFLVVDLIVATTLTAVGLNTLPPAAVSLPLKLLLLIATNGWYIILNGLLVNYGT
jgi:type III secretion protein R